MAECDRTKPCSACCVRGLPRECHFIAEDGNYAPIQQSYELRRLRAENLQLKQRFRALGIPIYDEESDPAVPLDSPAGSRLSPARKRRALKHTQFQESGWQEGIYFGAPGLATVLSDFASISINNSETLTHIVPRSVDLFTPEIAPAYAFATIFSASPDECIPQLLSCLPARPDIQDYLDAFGHRVSIDMAAEVSRVEIERFLSDTKSNSQSCPSMLALLFAILALGAQQSIWNKNAGCDTAKKEAEMQRGNVYIAAAMQALRLDSFLHKPSLMAIQTLILIGRYLSDSGRFLDAFALFGTTIRLAHSIGLHCHPKYLKPPPPTQMEVITRQKIWWHMLRIDEEYSMTFGWPLGISSIGTCCPPQELSTHINLLRFREYMMRFTVLARQILDCGRLANVRIDEFTDAIRALLETLPETLQFDDTWKGEGNTASYEIWPLRLMAAVYHCKAHTYLILLNRQRTQDEHPSDSRVNKKTSFPQNSARYYPSNSPSTPPCFRGRAAVLASSQHILSLFSFCHQTNPSILIDWSITQQAFNSSMLLLFDAIEHQHITHGALLAEQTLQVFRALESNTAHKLARYAIEKITRCVHTLRTVVAQSPHTTTNRRHEQLPYHTDIQEIRQSGAMARDLAGVENVMGYTGMQRLGDCGLQVSAQEAFAPISWGTPGSSGEPEKGG